jgi:ABC-2 type transport system ATP-binding protein
MLQRIGLAQALLGKPTLIFLDEPQSGLDPIGRSEVKVIMREAVHDGSTVLFSSHVLGDVEDVADRVAIIDKGRVKRVASLDALTLRTNHVFIRLRPRTLPTEPVTDEQLPASVTRTLQSLGAGSAAYVDGVLECTLADEKTIPRLIQSLSASGVDIFEVTQERMSLEKTFLKEFGPPSSDSSKAPQSVPPDRII